MTFSPFLHSTGRHDQYLAADYRAWCVCVHDFVSHWKERARLMASQQETRATSKHNAAVTFVPSNINKHPPWSPVSIG